MEPEYFHPFSKEPATGPYPKSDESGWYFLMYVFKINFNNILQIMSSSHFTGILYASIFSLLFASFLILRSLSGKDL